MSIIMSKKRKQEDSENNGNLNVDEKSGNDKDDAIKNEKADKEADKSPADTTKAVSGKRKRKRKRKNKQQQDPSEHEKDADTKEVDEAAALASTVYVEGIAFEASEDELREFFREQGDIKDIIEMRLPTWQDTGRLRGYGHVLFGSVQSAEKALTLSGKYPKSRRRYLSIQKPKAPKAVKNMQPLRDQPDGCKTVFIKNLPYSCTEDDVRNALSECGKIVDGGVRLVLNSITRQPKGFAYVEFKNVEGAATAAKKASKPFGLCLNGRPLFVDYEENKMKGSFRTESGRLWSKEHDST